MAQSSLTFTGRLLTGVVMLAAVAPAFAESPAPEIVSPLVATPIAPPNPVLGADAPQASGLRDRADGYRRERNCAQEDRSA